MSRAFELVSTEQLIADVAARTAGEPERVVFIGTPANVTGFVTDADLPRRRRAGRGAEPVRELERAVPDAVWVDAPPRDVLERLAREIGRCRSWTTAAGRSVCGVIRSTDVVRYLATDP
jgi:hypothetical protein